MDTDGKRVRQWLRQAVLLVLTCVLLTMVMLIVRAYVCTVFSDPLTGDRIIVNRLDRSTYQKGDKVVYQQGNMHYVGYVSALPGDTISLRGRQYQIRERCTCNGTECDDCRYYLVESGDNESLVNHHRMVGKAYKIW